MPDIERHNTLLRHTAEIVAAHVRNHQVAAETLPGLIRRVHAALLAAGDPPAAAPAPRAPAPAMRTVFPDYIVCLEDGRKMKTMKRHLRSEYNLSPEQYRAKWGLPDDYPMVAPNYAERRSTLAREAGLGRRRLSPAETGPAVPPGAQTPVAQAPFTQATIAQPAVAHPATPRPVVTPPAVAAPAPAALPELPEPPAARVAEPTAASVFARFPTAAAAAEDEPPEEPAPSAADPGGRKSARKPFAKQFARTMRR